MAGEMAELRALIDADTGGFMRGMDTVDRRMGRTQQGMSRMGRSGAEMGRTVGKGAILLGGGMAVAGGFIAKVGLDMAMLKEQTQIAFTTMLGSGKKATAMMGDLQKFAATTPFEFKELIPATQKLLAFGFAAKDVIPMLTTVGDAAAGLGLGTEGVNRITTALGQMQAKGKVAGGEIMQLTEAGINGFKYIADSMGISEAAAREMSEKGLIPAKQGIDAILKGMQGDFGGLMEKQSKTLGGQLSNLQDQFTQVASSVMEKFMPALTEGATKLNTWLSSDSGQETMQQIADGAATMASGIGSAVGFVVEHWGQLQGAFDAASDGISAAFAAMQSAVAPTVAWFNEYVQPTITAAAAFISKVWQDIAPTVASSLQTMQAAVMNILHGLVTIVEGVVATVRGILTGDWSAVWAGLSKIVSGAVQAVGGAINGLGAILRVAGAAAVSAFTNSFGSLVGSAATKARQVVSSVGSGLAGLPAAVGSKLTSAASAFGSAMTSWGGKALSLGKKVVSSVIDGLAGLGGKILSALRSAFASVSGHFSFPHPTITMGTQHVGVGPLGVNVPYPTGISFATGTVTKGAMMAIIGEKGREYVIPVTGANKKNGLALWAQAGRDLGIPGMATGGAAGRPPADVGVPKPFNAKSFVGKRPLTTLARLQKDYDANTSRWRSYYQRTGGEIDSGEYRELAKRTDVSKMMLDAITSRRSHYTKLRTAATRKLRALQTAAKRKGLSKAAKKAADARVASQQKKLDAINTQLGAVSTPHDAQQAGYDLIQSAADLRQEAADYDADAAQKKADEAKRLADEAGDGGTTTPATPEIGTSYNSGLEGGVASTGGGGGGGGGGGATVVYLTINNAGSVISDGDLITQIREGLAAYGKSNGTIFGPVPADSVPR